MKTSNTILYASYDFSNSGYVAIFQSFLFPIFLTAALSNNNLSDSIWGWIITISSILAIVNAPFLGRLSDLVGKSKIFLLLIFLTSMLAISSILLNEFSVLFLIAGFVIFNTLFELSQSLYDSFLLDYNLSSKALIKLSSFAWGFGYLGGALFIALYLVFEKFGFSNSAMLVLFSITFLLFSLPSAISFYKLNPANKDNNQSKITLRYLLKSKSPVPWKELLIYWIIADCVAAVLYFAPLYIQQDLHVDIKIFGAIFIGGQLLAFPLTIFIAKLAQRFGAMKIIRLCLSIWVISILGLFLASSITHVIIVVILLSFVIGSTQSILRAHFANRIDPKSSGEGLGYYAVAQKSASIVSPAVVAVSITLLGSIRYSFIVLILFLIIGFILSFKLKEIP